MLSRRLRALQINGQILKARQRRLFLWTFTHVAKMEPKEGARHWNRLLTYLKRWARDFAGIKVFEEHPGVGYLDFVSGNVYRDSHGLHVHFLCTKFFDFREVQSIARQAGWGRAHVVRIKDADIDRTIDYVGKYLCKKRTPSMKGIRLVSYVGMPDHVRLREIKIEGWTRNLWDCAKQFPAYDTLNYFGRVHLVQWLDDQCIYNNCGPQEIWYEWKDRQICAIQKARYRRKGWSPNASGDTLSAQEQLAANELGDVLRNQRFLPKAKRNGKAEIMALFA